MRHWFDEDYQDYQELIYEDEEETESQYFDVDICYRPLTTRREK